MNTKPEFQSTSPFPCRIISISPSVQSNIVEPMASPNPPVNPSLMRAANAYGAVAEQVSLTTEIVWAKLLRGILNNIKKAKASHAEGKLDVMFNINNKSIDVLTILAQSLEVDAEDHKNEDVIGAVFFLSKTYRETIFSLSQILSQSDVPAAYDALEAKFRPLVEHMEQLVGPKPDAASAESSQQETDVAIADMLS